jgi:hypothetical protein
MENAAGVRYQRAGSDAAVTAAGSPVLGRYADDLVAFCHTRQEAEQVKARLEWEQWLAVTRKAITRNAIVRVNGTPDEAKLRVLHAHCHRRLLVRAGSTILPM